MMLHFILHDNISMSIILGGLLLLGVFVYVVVGICKEKKK